jgi:CubicO group peptidase (beta-lactamase class C family)
VEFVEKLESFILSKIMRYKMPGLSIAIMSSGELVYAKGFGFRDLEYSQPATPQTSYCVGSVTKAFTAAAIMQLVERGLVSLEDPVSRYVDVIKSPEVEISHLLTHTSGIPALGYAEALIESFYKLRTDLLLPIAKPDDVLSFMRDYAEYPHFKPGERWFYLNEGYVILGKVIEKVTGVNYEEYVRREICNELGMVKCYFTREEYSRDQDKATPYYVSQDGGLVRAEPIFGVSADGGLYTSPLDLVKFAYMLADRGVWGGKRVLSAKSVELMETPHVKLPYESPTSRYYGYGLIIHDEFAGRYKLVGHSGSVYVYTAYMGYLPERKVAVAIASNISGYPLSLIGAYALALVAGVKEEALKFLVVDRVVERVEGLYSGYKDTVRLRVRRAGDTLILEDVTARRPPTPLVLEHVDENYAKFYIATLYTKIPVEFYIEKDRVLMIYERYLLVKRAT